MNKEIALEILESYKTLEHNWNGYGADPIPVAAIDRAADLLKLLEPTPDVFPTARGSIQFEWETGESGSGELYAEIEVYEDKIEFYAQSECCGGPIIIGTENERKYEGNKIKSLVQFVVEQKNYNDKIEFRFDNNFLNSILGKGK